MQCMIRGQNRVTDRPSTVRNAFRFAPAALLAATAARPLAARESWLALQQPVTPVQSAPAAQVRSPESGGARPAAASALLDSARAALRAGETEPAVRMAEQYTLRNFRDARGYMVLGTAYMARPTAGRFQALRAYEEAIRLAPLDPEPAYLYAQAGIFLGGDDGEAIARRGLERVLELDPLYGMAWMQWLLVFRNSSSRSRMRERLAEHPASPEVRARIAYLDIEDELYPQADSILDELLTHDSTNVEWLAWRAQSAFESGDTARGTDAYVRALTWAERDSTDVLWYQVIGIANPAEIRAWARVAPQQRGQWLAAFWARRTPNLFGGTNARLVEHFTRLRYARRTWPLLHPLVSYHRSQIGRALNLEPARGERDFYQRCEMYEVLPPLPDLGIRLQVDPRELMEAATRQDAALRQRGAPQPGATRARDRARMQDAGAASTLTDAEAIRLGMDGLQRLFVPLNMDLRSLDTSAVRIGYNLATGLDDRGVLYLRFGRPQAEVSGGANGADPLCATRDVEHWRYDEIGEVRFSRPSAFARGERTVSEMVFRAMNERQFEGMRAALSRDASSEPAPLEFGVWSAQFPGGRPGSTEIVVVSTRGALAASLVSTDWVGDVRRSNAGWVVLDADPGSYTLLAHARDSARLGRQELNLEVKPFRSLPVLSDLLLAPAWPVAAPTRYDMLRNATRSLTFPEGTAMRSYAEIYGLVPDGPQVRYRAEYALLRTDDPAAALGRDRWPEALRFSFERLSPLMASGITREVLDITPERLAPGRYALRLSVFDVIGEREAGRTQITFVVR